MSFGCSKAWQRRIQSEILNKYPGVLVVMARAYDRPRTLDGPSGPVTVPGVSRPSPEDMTPVLTSVRRALRTLYDPARPEALVVQFHPLGGFSWVDTGD